MGFNQSGGEMDAVYRDLLEAQRVSVSVQMPLVRWGGRSAESQAARSDLARTQVLAQQTREQLVQEAHFAALLAEQSRRQFDLSAKADTVAAKGFEVARNRYIIGKIGLNDLLIAQNAKDQALTAYVTSMRGYWLAYYRLRRATLYDFEAGESIR
jgi:outer membrane protein TolC